MKSQAGFLTILIASVTAVALIIGGYYAVTKFNSSIKSNKAITPTNKPASSIYQLPAIDPIQLLSSPTSESSRSSKLNITTDYQNEWKRFTSSKYGYTIQYPPDWDIFDLDITIVITPKENIPILKRAANDKDNWEIFLHSNAVKYFPINIAILQPNDDFVDSPESKITKKQVMVAGVNAEEKTTTSTMPDGVVLSTKEYYFSHNGRNYLVSFNDLERILILNKILSTFEFTE